MTKTRKEEARIRQKPGVSRDEFKAKYDPEEEVQFLRNEVQRLEGEKDQYHLEHGSLKSLFRSLAEAVEAMPPMKLEYKSPKKAGTESPITHVSHWCDWHDGAVQQSDEIEGFGDFSPDLLRKRIHNCVVDQLAWLELHRKSYRVDVSRDLFTGDMISGGIHPELLWTNEYPEPEQAIRAGGLVAELVAMKAPYYEKVIVDFVTTDNHGRLTKKPQCNEAGINCWGYVTAHYAKERLKLLDNVEFNIHAVIQTVVDVGGRKYLLCHGDRVRGWAGFPYYGLQRKVGREATKRMRRTLADSRKGSSLQKSIGTLFDRVVMGHWHAPLAHPWYWIGGSASGTTTYDHSEGREALPQQCSWFVHPRHGEFDRTDWLLRDD